MQLLLPSAKLAVLTNEKHEFREKLLKVLFVFGVLTVLLGGLDLVGRVPHLSFSDQALREAFEPAVLLSQ